jgi:hypothetical protein
MVLKVLPLHVKLSETIAETALFLGLRNFQLNALSHFFPEIVKKKSIGNFGRATV